MLNGDCAAARKGMERGLLQPGLDMLALDRVRWPDLVDYAYVLQRTGSPEDARALLDAMDGRNREAVDHLRRSAQQGGLTCFWCLRTWPQFDSLRKYREFVSLLEEQAAKRDAQRQRLASEGTLLTPEQVLAIGQFAYDPFDN
jgi:hypothetical protein